MPSDRPSYLPPTGPLCPAKDFIVCLRHVKEPGPYDMTMKISSVKGDRLEGPGQKNSNTQDLFFQKCSYNRANEYRFNTRYHVIEGETL